ncbi:hypothetical protein U5A82_02145 [Sphingobium sp. CR2-8]|uniref:hypothetical protein n=1 Tax=Sphingobium sp. CR2-8 TaxID=1306534 RepID=UPI002DBC7CE2|nr:hypothetical protein [Sphingobium sp. CR2-8]MEC3909316.1 hypothetical protein [Sphingobium sp. CR2-8]
MRRSFTGTSCHEGFHDDCRYTARPACWSGATRLLSAPVAKDRRGARTGWRYRANVGLRALAGTVGAYGVASLAAAALARSLPVARVEAVTIATMIAYLVAPGVTIWAFLARGPWRAVAGVVIAACALGGLAWMAGQPA